MVFSSEQMAYITVSFKRIEIFDLSQIYAVSGSVAQPTQ